MPKAENSQYGYAQHPGDPYAINLGYAHEETDDPQGLETIELCRVPAQGGEVPLGIVLKTAHADGGFRWIPYLYDQANLYSGEFKTFLAACPTPGTAVANLLDEFGYGNGRPGVIRCATMNPFGGWYYPGGAALDSAGLQPAAILTKVWTVKENEAKLIVERQQPWETAWQRETVPMWWSMDPNDMVGLAQMYLAGIAQARRDAMVGNHVTRYRASVYAGYYLYRVYESTLDLTTEYGTALTYES